MIPWGMLILAGAAAVLDISVLQYVVSVSALFGVCFLYAFVSTRNKYSLRFTLKLNSTLTVMDILFYSLPLLVIAFAQNSLMWINTLILGGIGSVADSAIFVSAMKVGVSISILLYTFNSVYVPQISAAYAVKKFETINKIYNDITSSLSLFSFLILMLAIMYSDLIMSFFGADYNAGTGCLLFLILGNVFNCYIGPVGYVLIMSGRSKLDAGNTVIALIFNAVLCFLAYQMIGVTGAGLAFFGSNVLVNMMRYIQCRRILGLCWLNRMQVRILLMQAVFIVLFLVAEQFSVNREVLAVCFTCSYLLFNVGTIRGILEKIKVRHVL